MTASRPGLSLPSRIRAGRQRPKFENGLATLALLLAGVFTADGGTAQGTDSLPSENDALVEVAFVSNRLREAHPEPGRRYGNNLGPLSSGRCVVDIQARSGRGELVGVSDIDPKETLAGLEPFRGTGLVVYIHGYYEDFDRSCRRAAVFKSRLGSDLGFLLFSWPANSTPFTYGADVADLEASTPRFIELLRDLSRLHDPGTISVIAHSLGTRGLVEALQKAPTPAVPLRDLILIASDMDREKFLEVLPLLRKQVSNISLFVSGRDLPLRLSEVVNGGARLGQGGTGPIDDVRVIDVTDYESTHLSGHVYHLRNEDVLAQIRELLER